MARASGERRAMRFIVIILLVSPWLCQGVRTVFAREWVQLGRKAVDEGAAVTTGAGSATSPARIGRRRCAQNLRREGSPLHARDTALQACPPLPWPGPRPATIPAAPGAAAATPAP